MTSLLVCESLLLKSKLVFLWQGCVYTGGAAGVSCELNLRVHLVFVFLQMGLISCVPECIEHLFSVIIILNDCRNQAC